MSLSMSRLALDTNDLQRYNTWVLSAYMQFVGGNTMCPAHMPIAEFVKLMGYEENHKANVYADLEVHVNVENPDLSDETTGRYSFNIDSTSSLFHDKLVQQVNEVVPLKQDFKMKFNGKDFREMKDVYQHLFSSEPVEIDLHPGSETAPPLDTGDETVTSEESEDTKAGQLPVDEKGEPIPQKPGPMPSGAANEQEEKEMRESDDIGVQAVFAFNTAVSGAIDSFEKAASQITTKNLKQFMTDKKKNSVSQAIYAHFNDPNIYGLFLFIYFVNNFKYNIYRSICCFG